MFGGSSVIIKSLKLSASVSSYLVRPWYNFRYVKHKIMNVWTQLHSEYNRDRPRFALRATVVLLAISLMILKRTFWTPDTLLIMVIIIGVVFGKAREFIVRFVPFLGMLVVYDSMRGIADDLNKNVHFTEMIDFDRWLWLGQLPTSWFQTWMWHGHVQWYDFYFYFLYMMHFLIPLIVGLLLWKYRPKLYWPFVWALVGISFAAFITYIAFPAAPPWMAKELGYIAEPLHRISSDVWWAMGVQSFSQVYSNLSPNAVAAVPSLHSAYPLIATLFIVKAFGLRRTWWLFIYPLSMWWGVVYLGEHYIFDVLAAILYVIVGIWLVQVGFRRWRSRHET